MLLFFLDLFFGFIFKEPFNSDWNSNGGALSYSNNKTTNLCRILYYKVDLFFNQVFL